ncbi:hypothetical protein RRG08_065228 [Elysia crispata]|uniref:Uncharacterized protein n=1 Tax=Elysia crispata TaxID=231223 RepID=A0AAE0YHZ3_9GAST|nr:hypothetical protein RRG08_065228 [Elysia crispata]
MKLSHGCESRLEARCQSESRPLHALCNMIPRMWDLGLEQESRLMSRDVENGEVYSLAQLEKHFSKKECRDGKREMLATREVDNSIKSSNALTAWSQNDPIATDTRIMMISEGLSNISSVAGSPN